MDTGDARRNRDRSAEDPDIPSMEESADLGASIAAHAARLAHLYLERARMTGGPANLEAFERDKSRARRLYQWAVEAAATTTIAGQDVLYAALDGLREELDSPEVARSAGAS